MSSKIAWARRTDRRAARTNRGEVGARAGRIRERTDCPIRQSGFGPRVVGGLTNRLKGESWIRRR